ncbi:hypothetical protein TVAG_132590 [Trichomonas vaginalis G3]|uniref:Uncharacterized protein n=1 Tax=Trichomonas vaginalis (strain ATCC PRA-98 / G3) TaxID=412133 RepID=A2FS98_TRIV3|nr:GTPase activation domain, GAP family [Trichomonas vaginalis G3]EAX92214.1 hypothetical protein TVAG_132590 [Trichomonas vaginalis G3]KAI5551182.1 GTPase activation domain, GAP family [Trichomonas vaginalis G3]|eukprot:XP_001305144.1 hypothetical protein [Trichomonas vaginalis G3]
MEDSSSDSSKSKSSLNQSSPPSPKDDSSSDSEKSSENQQPQQRVPLNQVRGSIIEQLEQPFLIATVESSSVHSMRAHFNESKLKNSISSRNRSYEDFKKAIKPLCTRQSEFEQDIFDRITYYIRTLFNSSILNQIASSDPAHYEDLFNSFPEDTKLDITTLIDLMEDNPQSCGLIRWVSQNLCQVPIIQDFQSPDGVKCMISGVRRDFWGRHKKIYWAVLYNDNMVRIFRASDNKLYTEFKCDIIWLSRSKKTIKFSSTPSKIDFMLVPPPGYDTELWETHALRSDNIPYYSSFPYFQRPLPERIFDKDKRAIEMHDMLIIRALLRKEVIKAVDSKKIMNLILTVYSYLSMNNGLYSCLAMREVFDSDKSDRELLQDDSYLAVLIELIITNYCQDYFRSVIAPMLMDIDRGQISFNGSFNIETASNLIGVVIRTLNQNVDKFPPQLAHIMSLMSVIMGVKWGTQKGRYLGGALVFFECFLFKVMSNGTYYFKDFHPIHPPAEFLQGFSQVCRPVFLMRGIAENFPDASGMEALVEPHRVQAVSFIEQACILKQQPSYTIIQKEQYNDAIKQIIEIAASRNHDGSFMRAIQRESLTTLRTPIAGSVMHFLYCLANHQ